VRCRTVKKGIEEARRERDARVARIELLKDAMSKHHETLLGRLGRFRFIAAAATGLDGTLLA
jgi:hypothetical protein